MSADDQGRVLAAVDLGSNSFHMIVARYETGRLQVLDRLREMVRLADGLDANRRLSQDKIDEALACLARFGERLRTFHADDVRAVGTNTLRKARNGDEFLDLAEHALGHPIDVISGREEARLIYLGALHGSPAVDGRRLVMDIGGGSTELILGTGDQTEALYSLFMGCVSVSKEFFPGGKITRKGVSAARVAVDLELKPVVAPLRARGWDQTLGCSGTLRVVSRLVHELDPGSDTMGYQDVRQLLRHVVDAGHTDALQFEALSERRRPVLPGGLVIVERLFRALKIKNLRIADGALREGLLYDTLGAKTGADAHDVSVGALETRYQVDTAQADRVESLVVALLDQVAEDWDLTKTKPRALLCYAARLHEIGLALAHSHYHRHGAYIAAHADLPGFTRQEQSSVAWLIAGHRRRMPANMPEHMRPSWRRRLPRMLALLRLAVVLARGRQQTQLPVPTARAAGDALELSFPAGWLKRHPLTTAALRNEASQWPTLDLALSIS